MADTSQEKTEQPTPKRLREARKKGQVSKSKDLETVAIFVAMFVALAFTQKFISAEIRAYMELAFRKIALNEIQISDIYDIGKTGFFTFLKVSTIPLLLCFLVAVIVGYLQVGPVFSMHPLKPDIKKLNMIENLKNMFKPKQLFELFKNVVKLGVIFLIAYSVLKGMLEPFLLTVTAPIEATSKVGGIVLVRFFIRFIIVFILVAVIDLFIQRKDYIKNLKMTKDEVKREYKEDEGDPHIKGQRRQLHMEMAMGDVRQNVQNADAVVTNPTHLAIAIKYDKKEMSAPQVVAKGQRLYAEFIKDVAKEFDVPIIRNVPLAWALIDLEIDDEIPEKLYVAVAEILTFVYKLKNEKAKGEAKAEPRRESPQTRFQAPPARIPPKGPFV